MDQTYLLNVSNTSIQKVMDNSQILFNLLTFKDITFYIVVEILLIAFLIAIESKRVENLIILLTEINIIQWVFLFIVLGLKNIGYIDFPMNLIYTYFGFPAILVLIIILLASKVK
jgi:hypothetical protein